MGPSITPTSVVSSVAPGAIPVPGKGPVLSLSLIKNTFQFYDRMSSRNYRSTVLPIGKHYKSNGSARRLQIAKRRGMYTVPRTRGALAMTERKYFDSFLSAHAMLAGNTWAGGELDPATLLTLCVPSEGSDIDNRVGRKISVHKVTIRGMIFVSAQVNITAGDQASVCRLVMFVDQQTNGAQAQAENLMSGPGAASAFLTPHTFQSTANFGRFNVLRDKTVTVQNPNMTWDGTNIEAHGLSIPFKLSYRFKKPLVIRFNGTNGGTVADIIDNSLHFIGFATSTNLAPQIYYQSRCVYTDS